jgi:hypothetical protein
VGKTREVAENLASENKANGVMSSVAITVTEAANSEDLIRPATFLDATR